MTAEELYRSRGGAYQLMGGEDGQFQGVANPFLMHQIEEELRPKSKLEKLAAGGGMVPVNYAEGGGTLRNASGQAVKRVTIPGEFEPNQQGEGMIPKTAWLTQQAAQQLGVPWEGESTQYESGENWLDKAMMKGIPLAVGGIMAGGALGMLPGTGTAAAGSASAGGTGGGMDWWDQLFNSAGDFGAENMFAADVGGGMPVGNFNYANPWASTPDPMGLDLGSSLGSPGNPGQYLTGAESANWNPFINATSIPPSAGGLSMSQILDAAKSGGSALSSILGNKGLGALLGGAASLLGGGDKPAGNITKVEDLPEWTKPAAMTGLADMGKAFAMTPYRSPVTMAGEDYYGDVLRGDYLRPESNPYIEAVYNKAAGKASAGVNALFSKSGRYGSGAHQGVMGETLGGLATDIYGANYTAERGRQQQLAMDSDDFGTASILQPFRRGQALLGGATSVRGGSSSAPYFRNRAGEVLAGALGGSRLLS